MAGRENERSGERMQKMKHGLKSLFKKPKDEPIKTSEQSSLPHRSGKPSPITNQLDTTQAGKPSSAQPVAEKKHVPVLDTVDTAVAGSHVESKQPPVSLKPIGELWNEAYEELKDKEKSLVKDYEAAISKDIGMILGSTSLALGAPGVAVMRQEQMTALVEKKVEEAKKNAWKLKYGDNEVLLRDLAEPVVNVINDAEKFVDGLVSANPYASIAWAGVSLLLPLFLNPSKQAASLAIGLGYISNLIVRSDMRQRLYERQYETSSSSDELNEYRDTLKELYIRILKFEAKCVVYYSKNQASRLGRDIVKWDSWDSLLQDITVQEGDFVKVYDIWKDLLAQDEFKKLSVRHTESIDAMKMISENIVGFQQAVVSAQDDTHREALIKWLSTLDPSINYNSAREKHQPETGKWLTEESADFKNWESAPNSFIWLNGKAGSGKTILSSSVIKHLKRSYDDDPQVALAYFYFRFDDQEKPSTATLARSLIKQLYCHRPNTPEAVEVLHKYRENGQNPDLDDLRNALLATIRGFSGVYIVLDALDEFAIEANNRKKLLDFIRQIHTSDLEKLHILCTSRREVDIEKTFKTLFATPSAGNIEVDLLSYRGKLDYDIGLHIDDTLASETFDDWPEELKREGRQALVEKADGMFQYVSCQFDALRDLPGPLAIRKALTDLPVGLDATYDRMLQTTKPEYRKKVSSTLQWLAFSMRPLTVEELAEIFILDHEHNPPFDEAERLNVPEKVLNYLPSLVTTVQVRAVTTRTEVRLAHFSIKEYLISPRIAQGPATDFSTTETEAHLHILLGCLAYHLHHSATILATEEQCKHFVLWEYAAGFWTHHLECVPRASWTPSAIEMASKSLTPRSQELLNMYRGTNIDEPSPPGTIYGFALVAAAVEDNTKILKLLLDRGADINLPGGIYGSALQAAACMGHKDIIQLLLDAGADINLKTGISYGNALHEAILGDEMDCVELLISKGAEVWPPGPGLEEEFERIEEFGGIEDVCGTRGKETVGKLRKFNKNPSGYIAAAKAGKSKGAA
ncbi:hypothetical protein V8E51_005046 [Hyaloscypha variabilis]